MTYVTGIPSYKAREQWDEIFPLLENAADGMGEDSQSLLVRIEIKALQVWTAVRDEKIIAACITNVAEGATRKTLKILACSGRDHKDWSHFILTIEAWGKSNGCTHARHDTRKGWEPVLEPYGYKATHIVLEKAL